MTSSAPFCTCSLFLPVTRHYQLTADHSCSGWALRFLAVTKAHVGMRLWCWHSHHPLNSFSSEINKQFSQLRCLWLFSNSRSVMMIAVSGSVQIQRYCLWGVVDCSGKCSVVVFSITMTAVIMVAMAVAAKIRWHTGHFFEASGDGDWQTG